MKLKPNIHENGIDYTLSGDCYLPELRLPEDNRPIGRWGRLHREYLNLPPSPLSITASVREAVYHPG